jgi:ADP-ribose pyrophosphatase YjhB (NUDIX family)
MLDRNGSEPSARGLEDLSALPPRPRARGQVRALSQLRAGGLRQPCADASAIVLEGEDRVLLARRASDPGAGLWDLLGGFIEEGEEPLAALVREVGEETSLRVEPGEYLGGYPDRYGDEGIFTLNLYWLARITGGELSLDEEELREVAWFRAEELPGPAEFAFANTVQALREWRAQLGS